MKTPRENVQVARKGNGSTMQAEMTAGTRSGQGPDVPSQEERIAVAAYFRAEQRNFAPGNELDDWIRAEAELCSGRDG